MILSTIAIGCVLQAGGLLRVGPDQVFTDIQSAIDAAGPGALLLVDPGGYPAFTVEGKDLAIVASEGSFRVLSSPGIPEIVVRGIAYGDQVTIQGARIDYEDRLAPAVLVEDNPGAVRLSELLVEEVAMLINAHVQAAVDVRNTQTFWLVDSSVWARGGVRGNSLEPLVAGGLVNDGISGLQLVDTNGVIQNSRLAGYDNADTPLGFGGDGLRVIGSSSAWLVFNAIGRRTRSFDSAYRGGRGIFGGNAVHQVRTPIAPRRLESCSYAPFAPDYLPGAGRPDLGGRVGGYLGFNNSNGTIVLPSGAVVYQFVELCLDHEGNENLMEENLVPIGDALRVHIRTRLRRAFLMVLSDGLESRFGGGRPYPGHALISGHTLFLHSGINVARTLKTYEFPLPADPVLIGTQVTVQTATSAPGGAFNSLSLPSFAVIVP